MSRKTTAFDSEKINLSSCVPACKIEDLHPQLVDMIRSAQKLAGFTFTITCGLRTMSWELAHGRRGSSSHVKGLAVDISARDSHTRYKVLLALAYVGVPRLGVGKTFIHADIDETKAHPIIFHYYDPQNT